MEIAKYAIGMLLVVGCGANAPGEGVVSHRSSEMGAEAERIWDVQTNALNSAVGKRKNKMKPLPVSFGGCTEFAGLTFVPTENVAGLVPPEFELAHFTTEEEAVVVVRIADCQSVLVKNGKARPGTVAQVGVTLAGPDATSDINNYTLWYVTNNKDLARELSKFGVDAEYSQQINYAFTPGAGGTGPFTVKVKATHAPDFVLSGTATAPTAAAVPFVASWWYDTCGGVVQMRTELPQIQFGASTMNLVAAQSELADLVEMLPIGFPGLDSYNSFAAAHMVVTMN